MIEPPVHEALSSTTLSSLEQLLRTVPGAEAPEREQMGPPDPTGPARAAAGASRPSARRRTRIDPVFIVSLARSGSTLLRYLLDSHPDVTSPPELNLSSLMEHVVHTWNQVNDMLGVAESEPQPTPRVLTPDVCRRARKVVDEIMVRCADEAGASVYCDKSLSTVDHLSIVSQCYPKASYIFLYRYPLDMIASGIEASKWGYNAYGFSPYISANPGNFVAGLANYWIDRTSRMLAFERSCTLTHARIYYELLCDDPAGTLAGLLDMLGLANDESIVDRALSSEHARGPGDYKIDFTSTVSPGSVGRGSDLPQLIGENQITRMNEILSELDYPSVEAGWRGGLGALLGLRSGAHASTDSDEAIKRVVELLELRLKDPIAASALAQAPFQLVIRSAGHERLLLVGNDRTVTEQSGEAGVTSGNDDGVTSGPTRIVCAGDVLLRLAAGDIEFAEAVHDRRVLVDRGTGSAASARQDYRRILAAIGELFRPDR